MEVSLENKVADIHKLEKAFQYDWREWEMLESFRESNTRNGEWIGF